MIEWAALGKVVRQTSDLYWLLAVILVALAIWKGRTARSKSIWTVLVMAVFAVLPVKAAIEQTKRDAYEREAWAYFKKKCETEAGERIYKTFTGVKSVLVVKPLPPATAKDLYDQFWYGDPYSSESALADRGDRLAQTLLGPQEFVDRQGEVGFDFIEKEHREREYERVEPLKVHPYHKVVGIQRPSSSFGVSWEDISTSEDRKYWVAGSRLRLIELSSSTIVAERIGFFIEAGFGSRAGARRPWQASRGTSTTCPSLRNGTFEDRWFVLKVLQPNQGNQDGK